MLKIIPKIVVYLALFLIPLFTLPFTGDALDFQKQFILFALTGAGIFFWIWNILSEKKLDINLNPLHFFAVGSVAVILISSIFSLYSYGSLWGTPLPVAESFVTALSFIFLYFLIVNNFKKIETYNLIVVATTSATIAAIYGILQAWGVYLLPFLSYTKDASFNTIGTANSLSLYAAIILATIFPLLFVKKNPYRRLMAVCTGFLFFALVFFNGVITYFFPVKAGNGGYELSLAPWIVLAVSGLATFVFSVSDQKFLTKNSRAKSASFAMLFVALLFLVFNIFAKDMVLGVHGSSMKAVKAQTSVELALDSRAATDIAISVLKQSSQVFFLGSGPGTFVYDYVKFKPQDLNQDNFAWNITFFAGSSEIINRLATTGLLGIVALLLIVVFWTIEAFRTLTGEDDDEGLPLAVFGGWLAIVVAMFFYPFNFSLAMLFWVFMAMIIAMDEEKMVSLPLKSVRMNYAITLTFIAILVLELGLLVWTSRRYYAETEYLSAVKALQNNNLAGAIKSLESAANSTDRLQDNYLTGLSQIYLAQAREELNKQDAKPEDAMKAASPYIQTAVNAAMLSTDTANPNNSTNWAARGYIYRQLVGISDGFDTWAINMYQKSISLEPNNPSLWTELGQVYILKKDLDKAKDSFNRAITLRPQYIDPHYYLALIHDQQNNKEEAIKELEIVAQLLPATDQASIDNVSKAIENLRQGNSLGGQSADQTANGFQAETTIPQDGLDSASTTNPGAAGESEFIPFAPSGDNPVQP
ncbi:MAG: tetratricopeptide repeat protein [Minisyncoccales bacterium]